MRITFARSGVLAALVIGITAVLSRPASSQVALVFGPTNGGFGWAQTSRVPLQGIRCSSSPQLNPYFESPSINIASPFNMSPTPPDGAFAVDQANQIYYWCDGAYIYANANNKAFYLWSPSALQSQPFTSIMMAIPSNPSVSFGAVTGMAAVPLSGFTGAPFYQLNTTTTTTFTLYLTDGTNIDLIKWTIASGALSWSGTPITPSVSATMTGLEFDSRTGEIVACDTQGTSYKINPATGAINASQSAGTLPNTIIGNVVDRSNTGGGFAGMYVTDGATLYPAAGGTGVAVNDPATSVGAGQSGGFGASFMDQGNVLFGSGANYTGFITEYAALVPLNPTQAIAMINNGGSTLQCPGDLFVLAVDSTCTSGSTVSTPVGTATYFLTANATLTNYPTITTVQSVPPSFPQTTIPASLIGTAFYAQWALFPVCGSCQSVNPCTANATYLSDMLYAIISDY